jgi:glycosyltransferase involved in cell wall biosynthesis
MRNPVKARDAPSPQAMRSRTESRRRIADEDAASATAERARREEVVMLLDNHYGPDPRVAFELDLLREEGISAAIIAWDRRSAGGGVDPSVAKVVRIPVPAPSGGGRRSLVAACRFGARVWRDRRRLLDDARVLIVHDVYLLPLGWTLARHLRKPFIYDAHEEYARMEAGRYPRWILRLVTAIESRLARRAVSVVVPGASRVPRWFGVLSKPPIVLPNLVRRDRPVPRPTPARWDLLYVGTVGESRRPDILIELARSRPELRIAIAGRGRSVEYVAQAAEALPNLDYLGWRDDPDDLLAATKSVYYGLDPDHPYSDAACPNTLYQALIHRKPLIFFCGGEPEGLAREFRIGIRCEPSVRAVSAAVDRLDGMTGWQFDEAWEAVWDRAAIDGFVDTVKTALQRSV